MSKLVLLALGMPGVALLFTAAAAEGAELPSFGSLILPAIIIIVLVLLNGLFVAAEFSLIGSRPSRLEQMNDEGDVLAGRMLAMRTETALQDRYIATAQLGITLASLGLGMYGEPAIAHFIEPYLAQLTGVELDVAWVHTVASVSVVSMLTYLHVVVGEMIPKSLALSAAETTLLRIARPMRAASLILNGPVHVLNGIGNRILQWAGVQPAGGHARLHSPEEIELLVTESAEEGLINEGEEEMIRNIFDFSDRQVGQVMTPRPKVRAIPMEVSRDELLRSIAASPYSRFPVYQDDLDHIVGILHVKHLLQVLVLDRPEINLRQLLRPAPAVPEDQNVRKLMAIFRRNRIHMAVVLDEFGGMAGIVTLEDLVEEIVGEVRDEFDRERESMEEIGPGVMEVAGSYLVDDLVNDVFLGDVADLPDVETVGGLIVTWLGGPPTIGDVFVHNEVKFQVLEVDGLAVAWARIEYPVPPAADDADEAE